MAKSLQGTGVEPYQTSWVNDLNADLRTALAAVAALTDSSGGTASDTLAAVTAGGAYAQADIVALKNAIASLAAKLNLIITTIKAG